MPNADEDPAPPRPTTTPADDPVAAALAAGDHLAAARMAVTRGELERALDIYDRLWRFADALPLALQLGRRPLAIRLALDLGDHRRAGDIAASIPRDASAELSAAAAAFAARGRHLDAGHLAERAGERATAATWYRRAGSLLDVGRLEEGAGRTHEAGLAYEQARARAGTDDERAAADLALGRLLARAGRAADAARAFQRAIRVPSHTLAAGRALIGALLARGYPLAANEVAARLRRDRPELPASLEELAALDAVEAATGAFPPVARGPDDAPAERRFKVLRALGAGATSQVYVAEDTLLGHPVALKLLALSPSGAGAAGADGQAYARFAREAEAAGRLRHPNIVALHDADPAAGLFVWELMSGGTLADRLQDGVPLPPAAVRRLAMELLSALGAAHEQGIVHRDVKPANVLFDAAGNAKLSDFGIAHLADFGQTQTGGLLGTVAYMAPEQISGGRIGPGADLYALGVTLFQALTGRLPFLGPDVVAQHLAETPPAPSRLHPGVVEAHDAVLLRALSKAPDERWESARDMREAVRLWPLDDGDASGAASAPLPSPAAPSGPVVSPGAEVLLGSSANGTVFESHDPRLGRPVLLERRELPVTGAALERLRAVAALGGPFVQRTLGLGEDDMTVTYERVEGPRQRFTTLAPLLETLRPEDAVALARAHAALVALGAIAPGTVDVTLSTGGPVLQVVTVVEDVSLRGATASRVPS